MTILVRHFWTTMEAFDDCVEGRNLVPRFGFYEVQNGACMYRRSTRFGARPDPGKVFQPLEQVRRIDSSVWEYEGTGRMPLSRCVSGC